ncbi:MAG: fluoride efflux transporter CrcB [Bacteroidota bacterium]
MKIILAVGFGSFLGGIARYLVGLLVHTKYTGSFPFSTFLVNVIGCLLIGVLFGSSEKLGLSEEWKSFLIIGVLGGFTTFSSFSNESIQLLQNGNYGMAFTYIASSIIVGLSATFVGFIFAK